MARSMGDYKFFGNILLQFEPYELARCIFDLNDSPAESIDIARWLMIFKKHELLLLFYKNIEKIEKNYVTIDNYMSDFRLVITEMDVDFIEWLVAHLEAHSSQAVRPFVGDLKGTPIVPGPLW